MHKALQLIFVCIATSPIYAYAETSVRVESGHLSDETTCGGSWFGHQQPKENIFTECSGGTRYDEIDCCDLESHEPLYTQDRTITCEDGTHNCAVLVGEYNACSGPISSLIIDEQDNIYFWAGRWQLHSLDKNGNFRWRYELCNPEPDPLSGRIEDCRQRGVGDEDFGCWLWNTSSTMKSTVLDYHGILYFFAGDVLHAIDSNTGLLLFAQQVHLQGAVSTNTEYITIANGYNHGNLSVGWSAGGSLVLRPDGLIQAHALTSVIGTNNVEHSSHILLTLSRRGQVVERHTLPEHTNLDLATRALIAGLGEKDHYRTPFAVKFSNFSDPSQYIHSTWLGFLSEELKYEKYDHRLNINGLGTTDQDPSGELAISPNQDKVYMQGIDGAVMALDVHTGELRFVFKYPGTRTFRWQSRLTIDESGLIWAQSDPGPGIPTLLAFDPEYFWENPNLRDKYCRSPPLPGDDEYCVRYGRPESPIDYNAMSGVHFVAEGSGGGFSTPLLTQNRVYSSLQGLWAFDKLSGEKLWQFGSRTMGNAPGLLSDGTLVVPRGGNARIFLIRERDIVPRSLSAKSWSRPFHDNYQSNHASHPMIWDRTSEIPYPHPLDLPIPEPPPIDPIDEALDMGRKEVDLSGFNWPDLSNDTIDMKPVLSAQEDMESSTTDNLDMHHPPNTEPSKPLPPPSECTACTTTVPPCPPPLWGTFILIVAWGRRRTRK